MLKLNRCTFCNKPVLVNVKGKKVFTLQCTHQQDIIHYLTHDEMLGYFAGKPQEVNIPVNPAQPNWAAEIAAEWVGLEAGTVGIDTVED